MSSISSVFHYVWQDVGDGCGIIAFLGEMEESVAHQVVQFRRTRYELSKIQIKPKNGSRVSLVMVLELLQTILGPAPANRIKLALIRVATISIRSEASQRSEPLRNQKKVVIDSLFSHPG